MPRRLNPCSYLPRRLQIVATLTAIIVFCIILLGTSNTEAIDRHIESVPFIGPQLQNAAHMAADGAHHAVDSLEKIPHSLPYVNALSPFKTPAHKPPPVQKNSTSGEASWYSDWKWRNPFSSSVTLDDDRTVLPLLKDRPAIYTYFDPQDETPHGKKKDKTVKAAEKDLLQTWRRSWWAQGFKPIILSPAEAMNHPLYRVVQTFTMEAALKADLMRWLAWANMGTGIMSNWLAVPMAPHDDPTLSLLRRGEFANLTRYSGLEGGLFAGNKDDIEKFLKVAVGLKQLNASKSLTEALPNWGFDEYKNTGVALYNSENIKTKYAAISKKLLSPDDFGDGMSELPRLINGHLHDTWQNTFSDGISVLKAVPKYTSQLTMPAMELARNVSQCPDSPIPSSCPPNRPKCSPCVATKPMTIAAPSAFVNKSSTFTIGTVPHPYTLTSLVAEKLPPPNYVKFIRRDTKRDSWIFDATRKIYKDGIPSYARLIGLKDAVASEYGSARSLWLIGERPPDGESRGDIEDIEFTLGFRLPREVLPDGKSETPVPGPERRPPAPPPELYGNGPIPSDSKLQLESTLLEQAKRVLRQSEKGGLQQAKEDRAVVEAWNMADTEAWKFVRAWNARRRKELQNWEHSEEAFMGKGMFARWRDHFSED